MPGVFTIIMEMGRNVLFHLLAVVEVDVFVAVGVVEAVGVVVDPVDAVAGGAVVVVVLCAGAVVVVVLGSRVAGAEPSQVFLAQEAVI